MKRHYYALAALLATLSGSALAVGPARCQNTASVALSARSLCGLTARDYLIATNLFGQVEASSDEKQIVDDVPGYPYTCGYDPCRGEMYDCELAASEDADEINYWSLYNDSSEESLFADNTGSLDEECEAWPTDARVDERYLNFERGEQPSQCGGDNHCPYFGGRSWFGGDYDCWVDAPQSQESDFDYWTAYQDEFDYWTAYQDEGSQDAVDYWTLYGSDYDYWTAYPSTPSEVEVAAAEQQNSDCQVCYPTYQEDAESAENLATEAVDARSVQETAATVAAHVQQMLAQLDSIRTTVEQEAWKTRAVEMPNWIEEYVAESRDSQDDRQIEQEYAQAELQAAIEAGEPVLAENSYNYGPSLPAAPTPDRVSYNDEYESLYDLDAIVVGGDDSESMEDDADETLPVSRLLHRLLDRGSALLDLLPNFEDQADELLDSAETVLEQLQQSAVQAAESQKIAERLDAYSDYADLVEYDRLMVDSLKAELPEETLESRELITSLAQSLRLTSSMLLIAADHLEAEATRVLSARSASPLSR